MARKIYLVFQGEYSDRHVIGVFLDKKKAEELIKIQTDKTWRTCLCEDKSICYEEHDLDDYQMLIDGYDCYDVTLYSDSGKTEVFEDDFSYHRNRLNHIENYHNPKNRQFWSVHVMAKSKEEAIKIGSDLIQKYRAKKMGISN